jgi:CheY-like chemotaxis protein
MSKRILIVDDHAPTRGVIRAILESDKAAAFEILEAANGRECLEIFGEKGPFDLVLLDVNMPDIDGYAACRGIREKDPKVPVIFVTANKDMKDYAEGRAAGGDSYLVKPVARAALRSIVSLFTSMERKRPPADAPKP